MAALSVAGGDASLYDAFCRLLNLHAWLHPAMALSRWIHILSAATWLGQMLLFFFLPSSPAPETGAGLLKTAFALYRAAAMLTFLSGINLLHIHYNFPTGNYFQGDRGLWMLSALLVATVMWAQTWFAMRPLFVRFLDQGDPQAWRRFLRLNALNVYGGVPVALGMMVASHGFLVAGEGWLGLTRGWLFGLGFVFVFHIVKLWKKIKSF